MAKTHNVKIVSGVEGPSMYINDYRVAGPKPWGGGQILHEWSMTDDDLQVAASRNFEKSGLRATHPKHRAVRG
jgi:hypothetical protein